MFRYGPVLVVLLASALGGCKDEKKPAEGTAERAAPVAGLAAVPARVTAVMYADVAGLASRPLVVRLVTEMLARDRELAARVSSVMGDCRLEPGSSIEQAVAATGMEPGESLLVLIGSFDEGALAACVGKNLSASGGYLTQQARGGRAHFKASGGPGGRTVYFALGSPTTLVVASSAELLGQALGPGEKLDDNRRLAELRKRVPAAAPLWAVGLIPEAVAGRLVGRAGIQKPPQALVVSMAGTDGLGLSLEAEMATSEDAKSFVLLAKTQVQAASLVAQKAGLGELVSQIAVDHEGAWVRAGLTLSQGEVEEILRRVQRMVDSPQADPQNPASDGPEDAPRDKE